MRPIVILALGWSLFVLLVYPGTMTEEAFASHGAFGLAWRALDFVIVAPFSVLAAQSLAWLAGAHLVARRFTSSRAAALAACASLVCAPILGGMAVVSSHALAVGLALLGGGLLVQRDLGRARWAGIAPLVLALLLVITAGDATIVTDKDRLVAAGIPWAKTVVQRAVAHLTIAPRGIALWLASAFAVAATTAIARRLAARPW